MRLCAHNRYAYFGIVSQMPPFLYRCPKTGLKVQGFIAEELKADVDTYETIVCVACQQVHLVNSATGNVIGRRGK